MQFAVLGDLVVTTDEGRPVMIAAPKRRALLEALLSQRGRPIAADRLVDALWGDDPPPAATGSLHAHMSRLRREIGTDRIGTVPGGYELRLRDGELDAQVFEQRLASGRRAVTAREWTTASTELEAALGLWRGPAFADLVASGAMAGEAARLETLRLSALEERVDVDLVLGRHGPLCAELEALVAEHPLRERFWAQLILVLYRSARQADALAAYRRLRELLVSDLGIDPSPALQELEIQILRQDPSLDGPPSGSIRPTVRLPVPRTTMVGRRAELDIAVGLLRSHRLLTFTGPGGVGKTRLAILTAYAVLQDHPDGVLFVDLASVRDASLVPARIGEVTGGGERPAAAIGQRRMLIVLDNVEQVVDAALDVSRLLDACPSLRILVTSRAPLNIIGEQRFEVLPLDHDDAAELFTVRARDAMASIQLRGTDVADIVARLDGLPLAVELAAARIGPLGSRLLQDRLIARLGTLIEGPRDAPDRHRTLRATIAWSYELLDPSAQAAFRRLSVMAGGFGFDAAQAVAGCDPDGLSRLVEQSLVRRVGERYSLLETIREYASEALDANRETVETHDRHLIHFQDLARASRGKDPAGRRTRTSDWLAMCHAERENLRIAFDWAVARHDDEAVVGLFRAVGMYWLLVGSIDEGERWGDAAIRAAATMSPETKMLVLGTASEFPRFSGDPNRAATLKIEALEIARAAGDESAISVYLDDLAAVHASSGDFAAARRCLSESMAIHAGRPDDDPLDRLHPLSGLIELAILEGRPTAAGEWIAELDAIEAGRDLTPDLAVQSNLLRAEVLLAQGETDHAERAFRDVISDASLIGFRLPLATAIDAMAAIHRERRPDHSARLIGMADRLRAEHRLAVWHRTRNDQTTTMLRATLGADRFERLRSEGHGVNPTGIIEAARVTLGPRPEGSGWQS